MEAIDPKSIKLPSLSLNSRYIFAKEAHYFVYPQNYNHYAKLFFKTPINTVGFQWRKC